MERALDLALRGWGQVAPNPLVGAVVVSDGRIVGEACHARFGAAHAERAALASAGEAALGATLYVNLEPCSHHGQTPPCTEAILESGVERVVFACRDPDPIAGGGAEVLRRAGVETVGGLCVDEAVRVNGPFLWKRVGTGPWITLKMALSLDGRISAADGIRTDISGAEARDYVHRLRAGHDAILVGGRTAFVDDPILTVRAGEPPRVPPLRVVLDPGLGLARESRLLDTAEKVPLTVFCARGTPDRRMREVESRGVEVLPVNRDESGLALDDVMAALEARGVESILVEGGARLAAALLMRGLVRRQHLIYAPKMLGSTGVPFIGVPFTDPSGWAVVERRALGEDTMITLENRSTQRMLLEAA
jgi:diaminohydroxyphosphoribosylaminopyrimidine deaminase/5-amino-6-(5-phosphoribosylamino)uracil reductase